MLKICLICLLGHLEVLGISNGDNILCGPGAAERLLQLPLLGGRARHFSALRGNSKYIIGNK